MIKVDGYVAELVVPIICHSQLFRFKLLVRNRDGSRVVVRAKYVHVSLSQEIRRQVVLQQVHRPSQDVATLPGSQEIRIATDFLHAFLWSQKKNSAAA